MDKEFCLNAKMWFTADTKEAAIEKFYNAMSLIPKGEEPESYEVMDSDDATDNDDHIYLGWSVEDVLEVRPDFSKEQAMQVLRSVESHHDASIGVTWDTLEFWADTLFPAKAAV